MQEETKKQIEEKAKEINKSIEGLKEAVSKKADLSALEEKHTELEGKLSELAKNEDVTKQQEQLDEISTQLKQIGEIQGEKSESRFNQIMKHVKGEDFQKRVKSFKSQGEIGAMELKMSNKEIYKAANIDTDDINSGTIEDQVEVGVASPPWRATPIWDLVNKGVVGQGRDQVAWWEETTRTDSAEMVTEQAAPSSGSAKTWTKQSMDIKMIKDYTKVSRSSMEDFEYLTSEVNDLIQNGIPRLRETQLLSGTGLTVYLKGITQYAKTFAKPSNFNKVDSPNEGDVLAAALVQCMNGNTSDTAKRGFMPNAILLNPGDRTNARLIKAATEAYVQHPMFSMDGMNFEGIPIVTSLDLAAGQFIVGDFSRAKAYVKRNMRISFHYENEDDVLNDLVLVLASMRIAGLKVAASDAYAFVTGTFAAGKPLISN